MKVWVYVYNYNIVTTRNLEVDFYSLLYYNRGGNMKKRIVSIHDKGLLLWINLK